ncbi:hypothetical protein M422DRAFT_23003 [Sphaerobolus stellatus SS14]|nr:hypothetical protein M422DRAFT_23003 [Sphaerobolus stellatus SS14]
MSSTRHQTPDFPGTDAQARPSMFSEGGSFSSQRMGTPGSPAPSTIFSSPGPSHGNQSFHGSSHGIQVPLKKPIIKSDPTLKTNFDPSDAELYALWAPAR